MGSSWRRGSNVVDLCYASINYDNMNCVDQFGAVTKIVYDSYM